MTVKNKEHSVVKVTQTHVVCDGGTNGHPRIYLKLKDGKIKCPYCGCDFVNEKVTKNT